MRKTKLSFLRRKNHEYEIVIKHKKYQLPLGYLRLYDDKIGYVFIADVCAYESDLLKLIFLELERLNKKHVKNSQI